MNLFSIRSLSLPLFTLAIAPLAAQGPQTFSAVRTQNYGVQLAGGSTTMRADATVSAGFTGGTLGVDLSNVANVRLFGFTREAVAIVASLDASHTLIGFSPQTGPIFLNSSVGSYAVRIGGFTVLPASSLSISVGGNLVGNVFPSQGVDYNVSILGFGVRVQGNATGRAEYTLTPTVNFANFGVDLNGPVRTSAVGSAGCSVSALGASAGVTATLIYANTNGNAAIHAGPGGATGTITFTVQQIRLFLRVFASLALPFMPVLTASETVFDHATAAQNGQLVLAPN